MINFISSIGVCPVCNATWEAFTNTRPVATAADSSGNGFSDFTVRICTGCGLGFTSPIPSPDSATELYEKRDTGNFDFEGGGVVAFVKDRLAEAFIKRLAAGREIKRVLDYSTGNGRYAAAAKRCFTQADVVATDFHPDTPDALRKLGNVRYFSMEQFTKDRTLGQFDLIILRHVLEHSYTPRALLEGLRDRLAAGGKLYIEVPNLHCSWASWVGKYAPGYYAPFHVFHFTPKTLGELVVSLGMMGKVEPAHMPVVGNIISRRWGLTETFLVKLLGISLFPLQLLAEVFLGESIAIKIIATKRS